MPIPIKCWVRWASSAAPTEAHHVRTRQLAQGGLSQARESVQALRPQQIDSRSIETELKSLSRLLQETGAVAAHFECCGEPYHVAPEIWTEMIRIAQESTTNVLKHAHAENVYIKLSFEDKSVRLTVSDDGKGIQVKDDDHDGFGLIGMHERAKRIGARLQILGRVGYGTRIALSVPSA